MQTASIRERRSPGSRERRHRGRTSGSPGGAVDGGGPEASPDGLGALDVEGRPAHVLAEHPEYFLGGSRREPGRASTSSYSPPGAVM